MPNSDPLLLLVWSQGVFCLFGGAALYSLFRQGHLAAADGQNAERDNGFRFLALGVWVWGIMAAFMVAHGNPIAELSLRLLSILNSAFLLLGASWLDVAPARFKGRRPQLRRLIQGVSVSVAVASLLLISFGESMGIPQSGRLAPELLFSLVTIAVLCLGLWASFRQRGFQTLSFLSLLTFVCHSAAQIAVIVSDESKGGPFASSVTLTLVLCSKIMLVSLFLALAISWLSERLSLTASPSDEETAFSSDEVLPESDDSFQPLLFLAPSKNPGEFLVTCRQGDREREHRLNRAHFTVLLELLVERRVQASHGEAGWIQPRDMESSRDKKPETTSAYTSRVNKELDFELIEVRDGQRRIAFAPED